MTKCYWLEETSTVQRYLRRYHIECKAPWRFLKGMVLLDEVQQDPKTYLEGSLDPLSVVPKTDPRWPSKCDCGHEFSDKDPYQIFLERGYQRSDNQDYVILPNAEPGAMWEAWWMNTWRHGPDGRCLEVRCPGGRDWCIDSRANNCTMPDDNEHRCWVRHGEPPNITVDKNGLTCEAGAGSIQTSNYHGFLRNGEFFPA